MPRFAPPRHRRRSMLVPGVAAIAAAVLFTATLAGACRNPGSSQPGEPDRTVSAEPTPVDQPGRRGDGRVRPGPPESAEPTPVSPEPTATAEPSETTAPPSGGRDLDDPAKKEIALQIVSTAENSSLDWRAHFSYIEDIGDGCGYTAGIAGFCSGTSDMLQLVENFTNKSPGNVLAKYLPALRAVDGSDSHDGLDPDFPADWRRAAQDPVFQEQQQIERDSQYFAPAVSLAEQDGVRALGQFAYYDAATAHGVSGLRSIRSAALGVAKPPSQGGDETGWLSAFLDARVAEMQTEAAHKDTSRVDNAQRAWLQAGNLDLNTPLAWSVYGDPFRID